VRSLVAHKKIPRSVRQVRIDLHDWSVADHLNCSGEIDMENQNERTTTERGRTGADGHSSASPNGSGTEASPTQGISATAQSQNSRNRGGAFTEMLEHQANSVAIQPWLDRAAQFVRRYPLQVMAGTIGVMALFSILRGRDRS
jgi:hypothetical protein